MPVKNVATQDDVARALEEFAALEATKRGPQCWVCAQAPVVKRALHKMRHDDAGKYTHDLLARFLRDKLGLAGATMFKVRHHFKQQHNAA